MVATVYGVLMSTCTRRVLVAAHHFGLEQGVDFAFEPIEFSATAEPDYPHPFRQVPYLKDGDVFLYESRAIAKYLLAKKGLYPSSPTAIGKLEQACSVEQANFDPAASGLAAELVFKGLRGLETDAKNVEALKATLAKKLEGYERALASSNYLAGDELTAADLFHLPYGAMIAPLGVAPGLTDGSLPNVARWWAELTALPAWAKTNENLASEQARTIAALKASQAKA